MVQNKQILKVFGTICLIFMIKIASSLDEDWFTESFLDEETITIVSQCIKPVEYVVNINFADEEKNFIIDSAALINVFCVLPHMTMYYGNCEIVGGFKFPISNTTVFFGKDSFSLKGLDLNKIDIRRAEKIQSSNKRYKIQEITPGNYWINATSVCPLNEIAQIFTYENNLKKEKLLVLPRMPAKWIFPYWIDQEETAKFTITVRYNNAYVAMSHMSFNDMVEENNMISISFDVTPVMPTHMAAIVLVPKEFYQDNFVLASWSDNNSYLEFNDLHMFSLLTRNDTKYAQSIINTITKYIRNKYTDLSFEKADYMAVPVNYENLVTAGLVFFKSFDIAYNGEIDSIIKKRVVTCLVARSTVQEVFSNWLAGHSTSWFTEGFTTVYGSFIVDQVDKTSFMDLYLVQTRRDFFAETEELVTYSLKNVLDSKIKRPIIERWELKAFSVFYMLSLLFKSQNVFYKSIFKAALNVYNNSKQPELDNIWTALEVDDNSLLRGVSVQLKSVDINIKDVIKSWITHEGYPVVKVTRNYTTDTATIMVADCFVNTAEKLCDHKWWIPVTYILYKSSKGDIQQDFSVYYRVLKPNGNHVVILNVKNSDHIMIIGLTGCRVNYDRETWKKIAQFLNIELPESKVFSMARSQILEDALYFLIQNPDNNENIRLDDNDINYIDINIFFELVNYLPEVKDSYEEWYPMFTALEYISKIFPYPESNKIKSTFANILSRFSERTQFDKHFENSVTNQLRHEILKWICILKSENCKNHINNMLKWQLQNPEENKFLPHWRKWIYCQGLLLENKNYANSKLWETIVNIYKTQLTDHNNELIELLTCSRHDNNFMESLGFLRSYIQDESDIISDVQKYYAKAYLNSLTKHSNDGEALKIILRELQFAPRVLQYLNIIINNIYLEEHLEKVQEHLDGLVILKTKKTLIEVVENKIQKRRAFISIMRYNSQHKLRDVLSFKGTKTM